MKVRRAFALMRAGILEALQFRLATLLTIAGNLLYLLLVYNLWKSIFASTETGIVNGMTFSDTMIYLVLASAVLNFLEMYIVWTMGREIQDGKIVVDLLRPMSYRSWRFFDGAGMMVTGFFTTFLPTSIVVFFVSDGAIHLGVNILFFVISLMMSAVINYYISFITGTVCIYTQSIWGINIVKEVILGLFSGALIPLAFFPDFLKKITMFLPFQTIVNSPMQILLHNENSLCETFSILGLQFFWLVALLFISEGFFRVSLKKITVNGG